MPELNLLAAGVMHDCDIFYPTHPTFAKLIEILKTKQNKQNTFLLFKRNTDRLWSDQTEFSSLC